MSAAGPRRSAPSKGAPKTTKGASKVAGKVAGKAPNPADPEATSRAADEAILDASLRTARVVRKGPYHYLVHPLMDGVPRVEPELLRAWTAWAARQDLLRGATLLLAPEAMGPVLAAPLALTTGIPYTIARKRSSAAPDEARLSSHTGYGSSTLHVSGVRPGDRVVVVDDVLSTGATLDALLTVLRARCTLLGALVFLDKGTARANLEARHGVPVRAMRSVDVGPDGARLRG